MKNGSLPGMGIKSIKRIVLLLLLFSLTLNNGARGEEKGTDLLEKSDAAYFLGEARFSFRMDDYEQGEYKRYYLFDGYVKGIDKYLLVGLEPAAVRGTSHLRVEDTIYYYMKRIDRMRQVSARVAFYDSLLSLEDVLSTKLAVFYDVDGWEKAELDGRQCYLLHLLAKNKTVAYYRIDSYIDAAGYLPVKREYYSYSGQKIKEMIFEEFRFGRDGRPELIRFTMHDSLRSGYYTKVTISDIKYTMIPDSHFHRNYLRMITP